MYLLSKGIITAFLFIEMKWISIICIVLTFNLFCHAEERSTKPFKDCFFIGKNLSSVQLIFENFNETYTQDNCFELIKDERIAQNVTFLKISGFINYTYDYDFETIGGREVKALANKFNGVRALDISNNSFRTLRPIISNFKNLIFLNASHNEMVAFRESVFSETSQLNEIDLSFNKMRRLLGSQFSDLPELKVIDLRNNDIANIYDAFNENRKLKILRLENNPMDSIGCNIFELLKRSVSIGISWDDVIWLSTDCNETKLKVSVENGNIIIRSADNHVELMCIDKKVSKRLRFIKIGSSQLSNVSEMLDQLGPSVDYLDLSHNFMSKLNATTFQKFTKFTHLKLFNGAENNMENAYELIQYLPSNLLCLDLSQNFVGQLNASTFQKLNQLWSLQLSGTNLSEFQCDPFEQLMVLRNLDISNNNLKRLNVTLLSLTLHRLGGIFSSLNISGNNLENIHEIIRHLNPNVQSIDLSGNYVGQIDNNTFAQFTETYGLYLKQTNLTDFNMNTLRSMKNLMELDISNNGLNSVDFTSQEPLKSLEALNINCNRLTELKGLTQQTYPKLNSLNIYGNQISCEYILNMKWDGLRITGDTCVE